MFNITDRAAREIISNPEKYAEQGLHLAVSVIGGGCTGFAYSFYWINIHLISNQNYIYSKTIDGRIANVFIDKKSMKFLEGATLDYRSTFKESGFFLDNPNAKWTCGCGKSVDF